jgi:hypothetical protein
MFFYSYIKAHPQINELFQRFARLTLFYVTTKYSPKLCILEPQQSNYR